ncbi:hypothetical protein Hanom_Chr02g00107021 [Helianthus anomalus]
MDMSTGDDVVTTEEAGGALPPLKWDQALFEQVVRGHQFVDKWDARYPARGQTTVDAPPGYITLYSDIFREGNFRLPATHFLGAILHHFSFHISQLSPMGMVRIDTSNSYANRRGMSPLLKNLGCFISCIAT